MKNVVVLLLL